MLAYAWFLQDADPDYYYLILQEDEFVEWLSFWVFLIAAIPFLAAAFRQRQSGFKVPWFLVGMGIFCAIVAMEEISWGQRIFGYRPPEYFLANNYQQEFNYHNIVDSSLRKLAQVLIIAGYGIVLPAIHLFPPINRLLARMNVIAPPVGIIPGFTAIVAVFLTYPWKLTGEIVELTFALGLLASGLAVHRQFRSPSRHPGPFRAIATPAVIVSLLGIVAALSTWQDRVDREEDPALFRLAQSEAKALLMDISALHRMLPDRKQTDCGLHKRAYTFVVQRHAEYLYQGAFASLKDQGLPEDRAEFFLDPWNSPYWIRHLCTKDRMGAQIMVYSFGPNRRRDTRGERLKGDDAGAFISATRNTE